MDFLGVDLQYLGVKAWCEVTIGRRKTNMMLFHPGQQLFFLATSASFFLFFWHSRYSEVGLMWHGFFIYPDLWLVFDILFWFTQNRVICICIYEHVVHGRFLRLLRGEPEPFCYMKTDVKWFQFFHFGGVLQAYFINTWTHLLHLDRWIVPLSRQV